MTSTDDRVLYEVDPDGRIATITLNNPKQRNSYDASMREALARHLDAAADDDDITVVLLRGAEGVFSTGADTIAGSHTTPFRPVISFRLADARWMSSRVPVALCSGRMRVRQCRTGIRSSSHS